MGRDSSWQTPKRLRGRPESKRYTRRNSGRKWNKTASGRMTSKGESRRTTSGWSRRSTKNSIDKRTRSRKRPCTATTRTTRPLLLTPPLPHRRSINGLSPSRTAHRPSPRSSARPLREQPIRSISTKSKPPITTNSTCTWQLKVIPVPRTPSCLRTSA